MNLESEATFELKMEGEKSIANPTPAQIDEALRRLHDSRNKFAILGKSRMEYIQIYGSPTSGYGIEHQRDVNGKHVHYEAARNNFRLDEVISLFQQYRASEEGWVTSIEWRKSVNQPSRSKRLSNPVILISRSSFAVAMCMLGYLFYVRKYQDTTANEEILGVKWIYFLSLMFVFLSIGFWSDFEKWDTIDSLSKVRASVSVLLAFFMVVMSLLTFLGVGNLAD